MKTAVADTSLVARRQSRSSHCRQHERVYRHLKRYKRGMTNSELARLMRLPASTVAARINHLKSLKGGELVEVVGQRLCRVTGFTAKIHKVRV